jgi:hypothetical protein
VHAKISKHKREYQSWNNFKMEVPELFHGLNPVVTEFIPVEGQVGKNKRGARREGRERGGTGEEEEGLWMWASVASQAQGEGERLVKRSPMGERREGKGGRGREGKGGRWREGR